VVPAVRATVSSEAKLEISGDEQVSSLQPITVPGQEVW
jgi:hypothetical protein